MNRYRLFAAVLRLGKVTVALSEEHPRPSAIPSRDGRVPCEGPGNRAWNPSEQASCEVWWKAGASRSFTDVYQPRRGLLIDWYGVVHPQARGLREQPQRRKAQQQALLGKPPLLEWPRYPRHQLDGAPVSSVARHECRAL